MSDAEYVLKTYGRALARIAASYEADPGLREDLVQEIMLAIHLSLSRIRDGEKLAPYVFRIAHNRGVSHVVRQSARRARETAAAPCEVGSETDSEQQVVAQDRTARLLDAVRQLPLPYRQVITLVLEELSYAEIAEALGISIANVGVRVNRAKARLKEMLDER